jgi:predicted lipase
MDQQTILTCANLSSVAYLPSPDSFDFSTLEPDLKFVKRLHNQSTSIDGFIAVNAVTKVIYIVYQGTDCLKDLVVDAEVQFCNLNINNHVTEVHTGFHDGLESIRPQLWSFDFSLYPEYTIYITGHSLGGALATLTCYQLPMPTKPHLCTFGSPEVGDKAFAALCPSFTAESVRMVHDDDLVPMLPGGSYVHVDARVRLDNNGNTEETFTLLKRIELWIKGSKLGALFSLSEHKITDYIAVIQLWIKNNK